MSAEILAIMIIVTSVSLLVLVAGLSTKYWKLRHEHLLLESRVWLLEQNLRRVSEKASQQKAAPPSLTDQMMVGNQPMRSYGKGDA